MWRSQCRTLLKRWRKNRRSMRPRNWSICLTSCQGKIALNQHFQFYLLLKYAVNYISVTKCSDQKQCLLQKKPKKLQGCVGWLGVKVLEIFPCADFWIQIFTKKCTSCSRAHCRKLHKISQKFGDRCLRYLLLYVTRDNIMREKW